MAYYSNTICNFIKDINSEDIFKILNKHEDVYTKEYVSWKNSLPKLAEVLELLDNKDSLYIFIKYHLKFIDKRIDVLLVGDDKSIVVELKQWIIKENKNSQMVIPNHKNEEMIHPSLQAREYSQILSDFFYGKRFKSMFCSYLHNAKTKDEDDLIKQLKVYSSNSFSEYSKNEFNKFLCENLRPIKTHELLEVLFKKNILDNESIIEYINKLVSLNDFTINVLDNQRVFYSKVYSNKNEINQIFILNGRAGSGKTVVAYKLLVELIKAKKNTVVSFPSSFLHNTTKNDKLPSIHPFSIINSKYKYDFIILDEAHRLKKEDLLKISDHTNNIIFLIDDYQIVENSGVSVLDIKNTFSNTHEIFYEELKYQLRSKGQNYYEEWVYNLFLDEPIIYTNTENFQIKVFNDINELENQLSKENNKKLLSGFTWDWNLPHKDGSLPKDIVIESCNWSKSWNNKTLLNTKKYKQFYENNTLDEVACIYTAQGVEYDFIGLIIGHDVDCVNNQFVFLPQKNRQKELNPNIIRNIYITLMTRAKKGIYIYCVNQNVSNKLKELISNNSL